MNKSNNDFQQRQITTIFHNPRQGSKTDGKVEKTPANPLRIVRVRLQASIHSFNNFNVQNFHGKCALVWPFENSILVYQLLHVYSQQDGFTNQISMLETMILGRYLCIFLPKFHCKLNSMEMMRASWRCTQFMPHRCFIKFINQSCVTRD